MQAPAAGHCEVEAQASFPEPGSQGRSPRLLTVTAAFVRGDDHKNAIALTVDSQQRLAFRLSGQTVEVSNVVHRLTVDAFDHVALLQAVLSGRAVRIDLGNHHARHIRRQTQLIADRGSEVLHGDATQSPLLNASAATTHER